MHRTLMTAAAVGALAFATQAAARCYRYGDGGGWRCVSVAPS
jgi:hypothetical protein